MLCLYYITDKILVCYGYIPIKAHLYALSILHYRLNISMLQSIPIKAHLYVMSILHYRQNISMLRIHLLVLSPHIIWLDLLFVLQM